MNSIGRREFLSAGAAMTLFGGSRAMPNIVLILADDLGFGDVQFQNPERGKLRTPRIDGLARQGVAFSDAHSGCAVCSPTRYGILTGRHAWRSKLRKGVLKPYDPPLIPPSRMTVASLLRAKGYRTACIGKWHLGWDWPREGANPRFDRPIPGGPTAVGFDSYFGTDLPNYPPYCFIENDRTVGIPSVPKPATMYGGDGVMLPGWRLDAILPALVRRAQEFIEASAKKQNPFFLYLPLTSPHTPLAVAEAWKGKSGLGLYGDWVMQTDSSVGEVLQTLDRTGTAENTLVLFASDNGCASYVGGERDQRLDNGGRVAALEARGHFPSAGWRGYKSDIWEGGHRIPLVARWPGKIRAGGTSNELVCLTDILATCADVVGSRLPADAGEDSVSILPALLGNARKPLHEAVVHQSGSGQFAIRQGRWKLALCPGSGGSSKPNDQQAAALGMPPVQLYDLAVDPGETRNLQATRKDVVDRLIRLLEKYVADGRSTPGPKQANDAMLDFWKTTGTRKPPAG
ncbi:MAG: arylsulfatase [Acidobacteria bacterium]|nr:arylsulfatase [Acidobacteriota bacterium]